MNQFFQLLVLGMATGGFYALNALGLVVVFRSSGIINFASGGVAMLGGYLEWQLADAWGTPPWIAVPGAVLFSAGIGLGMYALAIRPLHRAATLTQVIATLAILVSLQQSAILIFGGVSKVPAPWLPTTSIRLGSITVGTDSLIILSSTTLLTAVLWAVYRYTSFGLATSALAEAPRSLQALGWDITRLRAINWAVGGGLAGLAGVELGPILQLAPGNFTDLLIPTLAGAMIGGLRSFPMTLVGAVAVGAMQAEANRYLTWSGSGSAVPFLVIVAVLVLRGRSLPLRSFVQERLPRVGSGQIPVVRLLLGLAATVVLALTVNEDWVIGATITVMAAVVLLSQVVITGYAGQLSLAQWTIGGTGAIVAANVGSRAGLSFLPCLLIGMLAVVPISVLVGLPSLRARGVSLAVATLGFAVAINAVVLTNDRFSGGLSGLSLPPPEVFGIGISSVLYPRRYFLVCLAVFGVLALMVANLRRGRVGRRLLAVRNNERAAAALGINVTSTKLYAFVLAGMVAAAGGVLLIFNQVLPQFSGFDPLTGLNNLVAGILGGVGYVGGAVFGGLFNPNGLPNAVLYPLLGNVTWWTNLFPLLTGIIVTVQLIANPDGAADVVVHGTPKKPRQRSRRYQEACAAELSRASSTRVGRRGQTLTATGVRVVFGSVVAVDDVDITVCPGEVLAVIGPNGAGKTTLMDALTGFVPMSGTINLDQRRIDGLPVHRRARLGIARSFQSLELLEDMTVMDNLRCAADPQDVASLALDLVHPGRGAVTPAMAAAVETFGLLDKLDRMPTEIGFGDRRLVAIARTVAGEPSVLLLDEPAAGLSEFERQEVARVITMMAREWGIAVLLIEHDVALVRQVADAVVALDFGRVIARGPADDVLAHPDVIRAYLGTPDEALPTTPKPAPAGELDAGDDETSETTALSAQHPTFDDEKDLPCESITRERHTERPRSPSPPRFCSPPVAEVRQARRMTRSG